MNGEITADKKYKATFGISSYHVDARQLLKPSAFMDLAQEVAYHTSNVMHFGFDDLQKNNFVWVLTRMRIRFIRRPAWREQVEFSTWCKEAVSVFFIRDFRMNDAEGNAIIEATSSWTVIDVSTRRMVHGSDVSNIVSPEWICADSVCDHQADKIVIPKDLVQEYVADRRVAYSDIDVVGHVNNARYVVWAMDCMDYDFVANHTLQEVSINFNQECKPGDVVSISRCHQDGRWYVLGKVDGRQMFAVEMVLG